MIKITKTQIFLKNNYKWLIAITLPMIIIIPIVLASSHNNPNPNQQTYELLIKKAQTGEGNGAYEKGDIVMIQPEGYDWAQAERQNFNIVKIELNKNQLEQLTKPKEKNTGKKDENGNPIMEQEKRRKNKVNNLQEQDNGKTIEMQDVMEKLF